MFRPPQDALMPFEALFRAAEIRAIKGKLRPPMARADNLPGSQWLLRAARRELERRAVRRRYLPHELFSDAGWWILLDLFVCDYEIVRIRVIDAPQRWNLSHATAARQIAALIESGLVMRVFDENSSGPVTLRLTAVGKQYLSHVLALCE